MAAPSFKQYREQDGQFYFKLLDAHGKLLLQSSGFASPRDAGVCIKALQEAPSTLPPNVMVAQAASTEEALQALRYFLQANS